MATILLFLGGFKAKKMDSDKAVQRLDGEKRIHWKFPSYLPHSVALQVFRGQVFKSNEAVVFVWLIDTDVKHLFSILLQNLYDLFKI